MYDTTTIFEQVPDIDTFGGRLSRARDASGLSVKDLAWRLGIKNATVSAWEADRSLPSSHRLTQLSGLLNVSLSWMLHGIGSGPAHEQEDEANCDPAAERLGAQLARLKALHAETSRLIGQIQHDLARAEADPAATPEKAPSVIWRHDGGIGPQTGDNPSQAGYG